MLFRLLTSLEEHVSFFNVFRYITVRSALAGTTAFILSLLLGPWLIRCLKSYSIGQEGRAEGPQAHPEKAGTPTIGGALIVVPGVGGD